MTEMTVTHSRIRAGHWEATIGAPGRAAAPHLCVWYQEQRLSDVAVIGAAGPEAWAVSAPVPADLLSDGVQTFLIRDEASGDTVGHFTIIAGEPLEHDIRAEIDLMRAELDLLKKAFRRHCTETS